MKILCLFVRNGTDKYANALSVLDRWYENNGLMGDRTLWIIDNAIDADSPPQVLAPRTLLRPGNNQAWEFSAWARAVGQMDKEPGKYDVVHFVTSAFNTLYTAYLGHFAPGMLPGLAKRNFCLGHIDSYARPVILAGQS